jgi:tetratricopeptide (TPR) repeat protein
VTAEELNEQGRRLDGEGDTAGAEKAYREAMALEPEWSVPVFNLGLIYKYQGNWPASLECNRRAAELNPQDEGAWWNLGIAATALANWSEARRAWAACGLTVPEGAGAPDFGWGMTPVRLEPDGAAEVVWARRIDPARAEINSIPLPTSSYRFHDIVLNDGAPAGQRIYEGRVYSVFNSLQLLSPSPFQTFVVELGTDSEEAINALGRLAVASELGAEYWGKSTKTLCRECSLGLPETHAHRHATPAHPHFGLAAREEVQARAVIDTWLETSPGADIVEFYPVPRFA